MQHRDWNWEDLFQAANAEGALPALSSALAEGLELSLPSDVSDFLASVLTLNRERNALIREETATAARLLNDHGIEPVLLKGLAYLATGVYKDPGARFLLDIDLLVPEAQLDRAAQILKDNGYFEDDSDRFGHFRHHHPQLSRPGSPAIEIHHRLGMGRCGSLLPAREVIARSVPFDLDGARVRVPCPEHLMTHLIMHSQMQHPYHERIWPPVRAMYDLIQLQRSASIDWNIVEKSDLLILHLLDVRTELGFHPPLSLRRTVLIQLRQLRRRLIRQFPLLRYLDPIYMFSEICTRRVRVLRNVLTTRNGLKYLLEQLSACDLYHRFLTDVLEGRGR